MHGINTRSFLVAVAVAVIGIYRALSNNVSSLASGL
jgi:hypothetical protein